MQILTKFEGHWGSGDAARRCQSWDDIKDGYMREFIHFSVMSSDIKIVNCMRELRLAIRIDIEAVHRLLPDSKCYRGRPQMVVVKMSNGRNLQLFPSGCIQILGRLSYFESLAMCYEIMCHLQKLYPHVQMPKLTLKNLVASTQLQTAIPLHRLKNSTSKITYEPELFPAALLTRFHPVHIATFHTGKCIITGLKSLKQAKRIVDKLTTYLLKKELL